MTQITSRKGLDIQSFYSDGPGALNSEIFKISHSSQVTLLLKRAEKLRMALLILAGTLEVEDKSELFKLANNFIYQVIDFLTEKHPQEKSLKSLQATLLKIAEFLDYLVLTELLNLSNAEIIKSAIVSFLEYAGDYQKEHAKKTLQFKEEDFSALAIKDILRKDIKDISDKGHIKDKSIKDIFENSPKKALQSSKNKPSKSTEAVPKEGLAKSKPRVRSVKLEAKMQSRRMQILELLKMESPLTASEIRKKLKGSWGQKTIQRELLSMTEEGILKKEGEKRWTRYSIKV